MENLNCLECRKPIRGRADKKFCSAACRNSHHNRKNGYSTQMVRDINRVLKKNRNILMQCHAQGKAVISKKQLSSHGFDFNYFTNKIKGREGEYYFCYDQGYVMEGQDKYKLVDRKTI